MSKATTFLSMIFIGLTVNFIAHAQCDTYELVLAPKSDEKFSTAEYKLWIPEGLAEVERIILHQHGCGKWAQHSGRTVTDDLYWKLLAQKTNSALLGSSLWPDEDCRDWCDPNNGTERAFLQALDELSAQSGHPEIATVNWIIWGHSGGAFWTHSMLQKYPRKFEAAILQSGGFRERNLMGTEMTNPPHPKNVPLLVYTGIGEKNHERFHGTYVESILFFKAMRENNAPVTLVIDPASGHNAGNSRYLTIPWIAAVLKRQESTEVIKPNENSEHGIWFPNQDIALKWEAFSKLGTVPDQTAPKSPPFEVEAKKTNQGISISWNAIPDWESGVKAFRIYRDGELLPPHKTPLRPIDKEDFTENFREPNGMDTPNEPLSQMIYHDTNTREGTTYRYQVSLVNWAGQESAKSRFIEIKSP